MVRNILRDKRITIKSANKWLAESEGVMNKFMGTYIRQIVKYGLSGGPRYCILWSFWADADGIRKGAWVESKGRSPREAIRKWKAFQLWSEQGWKKN